MYRDPNETEREYTFIYKIYPTTTHKFPLYIHPRDTLKRVKQKIMKKLKEMNLGASSSNNLIIITLENHSDEEIFIDIFPNQKINATFKFNASRPPSTCHNNVYHYEEAPTCIKLDFKILYSSRNNNQTDISIIFTTYPTMVKVKEELAKELKEDKNLIIFLDSPFINNQITSRNEKIRVIIQERKTVQILLIDMNNQNQEDFVIDTYLSYTIKDLKDRIRQERTDIQELYSTMNDNDFVGQHVNELIFRYKPTMSNITCQLMFRTMHSQAETYYIPILSNSNVLGLKIEISRKIKESRECITVIDDADKDLPDAAPLTQRVYKILIVKEVVCHIILNDGNSKQREHKKYFTNQVFTQIINDIRSREDIELTEFNLDFGVNDYIGKSFPKYEIEFNVTKKSSHFKVFVFRNEVNFDTNHLPKVRDLVNELKHNFNGCDVHIEIQKKGTLMKEEESFHKNESYEAVISQNIRYINENYFNLIDKMILSEERQIDNLNGSTLIRKYPESKVFVNGFPISEDQRITPKDKIVIIPVGCKLKFSIEYNNSKRNYNVNESIVFQSLISKVFPEIQDPVIKSQPDHQEMIVPWTLTAAEVFSRFGNVLWIQDRRIKVDFIVSPVMNKYIFYFEPTMRIQKIKSLISQKFIYGNKENGTSPIKLMKSKNEVIKDENQMIKDFFKNSQLQLIIQPEDAKFMNLFNVVYTTKFINHPQGLNNRPIGWKFKFEPKIKDLITIIQISGIKMNMRLKWDGKEITDQLEKPLHEFNIPIEESIEVEILNSIVESNKYTFNIHTIEINDTVILDIQKTDIVKNVIDKLKPNVNNKKIIIEYQGNILQDDEILSSKGTKFDVIEVRTYEINIYPISYRKQFEAPISKTIESMKQHKQYFKDIDPNDYFDIYFQNKPISDTEPLLDKMSFNARPRALNISFCLDGNPNPIQRTTLTFSDNFRRPFNDLAKQFKLSLADIHIVFDNKDILIDDIIYEKKIVNNSILYLKLPKIKYCFIIKGEPFTLDLLPTTSIDVVLNELKQVLKTDKTVKIPNIKTNCDIAAVALMYRNNPIEVIHMTGEEKPYKFVCTQEGKEREVREYKFCEDETVAEVRKIITEKMFNDDVDEDRITLFFAGKALSNYQVLKNINIPPNAMIYVFIEEDLEELETMIGFSRMNLGDTLSLESETSLSVGVSESLHQ